MKKKLILLVLLLSVASLAFSVSKVFSTSMDFPFFDEYTITIPRSVKEAEQRKEFGSFTPSAESKTVPEDVTVEVLPVITTDETIDFDRYEKVYGPEETELIQETKPIVLVSRRKGLMGDIVGSVLREDVQIVAYAQRSELEEKDQKEFVASFNELKDSEEFNELIKDLDVYLEKKKQDKLAATQIFFIKPVKNVSKFIDDHELLNLRIMFRLSSKQEIPTIVVKTLETGEWYTIDPKTVLRDWVMDNTICVDFHTFGTIVFLEPRKM